MYLLTVMHNSTKTFVLKFIIYIIVFLVILDQLFTLTKFINNYSKYYDFGKMMRKTCDSNYTEYETERFQTADNLVQIKINNDKANNKYHVLIFILSIMLGFYINYLFTYVFIENMFNNVVESIIKSFSTANPALFANPIVGGITTIINIFKKDINEYINDNSVLNQFFTIFIAVIKVILLIYLMLSMPITIIVKLAADKNISPFGSHEAIITFHFIMLAIILLFGLIFGAKALVSYFSYILLFAIYIIVYEYMMIMIDISMNQRNPHIYENSDNNYLKNLTFSHYYFDSDNTKRNIITRFFLNIFGLNTKLDEDTTDINADFKKSFSLDFKTNIVTKKVLESAGFTFNETKTKTVKTFDYNPIIITNYNVVLLLFAILIIILFIIYLFLIGIHYAKGNGNTIYNIFNEGNLDSTFLYYFIMVPILFVFIVLLIILATKEYNTIVNKYILYKPYNQYRRNINKLQAIFNQILVNDKSSVSNDSVCQNTANAIHLVIYTNLFKFYDKTKLFVPELSYVTACSKSSYIDYNNLKGYNFDYYAKSIFHSDTNCINFDNNLLIAIMKGAIPIYTTKSPTDADYKKLKNMFVTHLKYAIHNLLNKKTYDGKRDLAYTSEYALNNTITSPDMLSKNIMNIDNSILLYASLIDDISDEYIKYSKSIYTYTLRVLQSLIACNTSSNFLDKDYKTFISNLDDFILNKSNGPKSSHLKKTYIAKYQELTSAFIQIINTKLTSQIKTSQKEFKLTKFIIDNYNYFHPNEYKFNYSEFYSVDTRTKNILDSYKYADMEDVQITIKQINTQIEQLATLFKIDINYDPDAEQLKIEEDMEEKEKKYTDEDYSNNADKIVEKTIDINNDITILQEKMKNYIDNYKSKYQNSKDYNKQLIYEYKNEYINSMIKLFKNVVYDIKTNYNFFQTYDASLQITEFTKYDIVLTKKENNIVKFDYYVYKNNYESIMKKYETYFDVVFKLANDMYKSLANDAKYQDIEHDEEDAKNSLAMAQEASSTIYALIIIYIIIIILVYYIQ